MYIIINKLPLNAITTWLRATHRFEIDNYSYFSEIYTHCIYIYTHNTVGYHSTYTHSTVGYHKMFGFVGPHTSILKGTCMTKQWIILPWTTPNTNVDLKDCLPLPSLCWNLTFVHVINLKQNNEKVMVVERVFEKRMRKIDEMKSSTDL